MLKPIWLGAGTFAALPTNSGANARLMNSFCLDGNLRKPEIPAALR